MKAQKLNQRQTRWVLYLSRFDFILKHIASKGIGQADNLNRRANWVEGVEKDNEIVKVVEEIVTNFIQLVSPQPVDRFSQTKLRWKAPNEGYLHIYRMYKSNNKQLRYQIISNCKIFVCYK